MFNRVEVDFSHLLPTIYRHHPTVALSLEKEGGRRRIALCFISRSRPPATGHNSISTNRHGEVHGGMVRAASDATGLAWKAPFWTVSTYDYGEMTWLITYYGVQQPVDHLACLSSRRKEHGSADHDIHLVQHELNPPFVKLEKYGSIFATLQPLIFIFI
jgi:hypothetical protein